MDASNGIVKPSLPNLGPLPSSICANPAPLIFLNLIGLAFISPTIELSMIMIIIIIIIKLMLPFGNRNKKAAIDPRYSPKLTQPVGLYPPIIPPDLV